MAIYILQGKLTKVLIAVAVIQIPPRSRTDITPDCIVLPFVRLARSPVGEVKAGPISPFPHTVMVSVHRSDPDQYFS